MGARTWEEGSLRTQPIPLPVGVGHPSSTAPQRLQVVSCKASRDSHAPPSTQHPSGAVHRPPHSTPALPRSPRPDGSGHPWAV